MSTAKQKLKWINDRLEEGRTIRLATYTKVTEITPKTMASFAKVGSPIFRIVGNSLYIARGKNWDCVDYSKITATAI